MNVIVVSVDNKREKLEKIILYNDNVEDNNATINLEINSEN